MLRNYLTTALRIMLRQQGFTAINITGLTVGIACSLLLILYIHNELTYDHFHTDADRIYRVGFKGNLQGNQFSSAETGAPLAHWLQKEVNTIESTLRIANWPTFPVRYKDKTFTEPYLLIADSNFFSFFDFELIEGNPREVLKHKDQLVISESAAQKYFGYKGIGDKSPIGKKIYLAQGYSATVAGIAKDAPVHSHFHFKLILSMASWSEVEQGGWMNRLVLTYFKLKPGQGLSETEAYYSSLIERQIAQELQSKNQIGDEEFKQQGNHLAFFSQPLTSIHLNSSLDDEIEVNGNLQYIYLFGAIALFITFLACINFTNLSTARSASRAKEVGVRKTVGAVQRRVIFQFLFESYLYTTIAIVLALLLVWVSLLPFNLIAGTHLTITSFFQPVFMVGLFFFLLIVGALAGSYPAFYLSFFNPVEIIKGQLRSRRKIYSIRNAMVIFQFFISIVLIISTWMIFRQQQHIRHTNVGFDTENVIALLHTANLKDRADEFKTELLRHPEMVSASYANRLPPNVDWQYVFHVHGEKKSHLVSVYEADEDHLRTMGYRMQAGRFFQKGNPSDTSAVILNETAARKSGISTYEGILLSSSYDQDTSKRRTLIGIIRDFNFRSLKDSIQPLAIVPRRKPLEMAIRITPGGTEEKIKLIKTLWTKYVPDAPFEYSFIDQNFNAKYASEKKIGEVFFIFTLLAIFIACLGLFGLAAHTADQRSKEMGIRKAMGASPYNMVILLTKGFAKLIVIAFLLAAPVAWLALDYWLDLYPYRIPVSLPVIFQSGAIALAIGLLTIIFNAWTAANADPVKALRNE